MHGFLLSLLNVVCEMAPYLLLGFFIAGVLHVFVPQKFYANYLSRCVRYQVPDIKVQNLRQTGK